MLSLPRLGASLALSLVTLSPLAAQKPDFSGTWVMQADKSDFGMLPAPSARTDVIEHKGPSLVIKRTITAGGGENVVNLTLGIDGKTYKNPTPQGELTSTLAWEGNELVITNQVDTPQGAATIVDRLSISADGKTLTQKRNISISGQEIPQTIVLVRQ